MEDKLWSSKLKIGPRGQPRASSVVRMYEHTNTDFVTSNSPPPHGRSDIFCTSTYEYVQGNDGLGPSIVIKFLVSKHEVGGIAQG